jgi:hypothetical protein
MLAKIHLKTACGCTKEFFDSHSMVYPGYRVPIAVNHPWEKPLASWEIREAIRAFVLVDYKFRSKYRVEVWYEEVFNG